LLVVFFVLVMKSFIVQKNDFIKEALFFPENKEAELIKL
jgi:hypothetical protein